MKKLVNLHCPHQVLATQTNFSSSSKHGVFTTLINDDLMIIIIMMKGKRVGNGDGTSKKRYPTTFEITPPSNFRQFLNLENAALRRTGRRKKGDFKTRND